MKKVSYEILKTPNSRFLYQESFYGGEDWQELTREVDNLIEENPKLSKANSYYRIYFFSLPEKENDYYDHQVLVGREIIGHDDFDEIEELSACELDRSQIYSFDLSQHLMKKCKFNELIDVVAQNCLSQMDYEFKNSYASTWRLSIGADVDGLNRGLAAQFFIEE